MLTNRHFRHSLRFNQNDETSNLSDKSCYRWGNCNCFDGSINSLRCHLGGTTGLHVQEAPNRTVSCGDAQRQLPQGHLLAHMQRHQELEPLELKIGEQGRLS